MNLGPPTWLASSERPFQPGRVLGSKSGVSITRDVEWLVDTGAEISTIWHNVGQSFDVSSTGLSASPTTGGGGIQVVTGLVNEFQVEDAHGAAVTVLVAGYVGIKSTNGGNNVLGMPQLAQVGARVAWDPRASVGSLTV